MRLGVAPTVVPYSARISAAAVGGAVKKVLSNVGSCVEAAKKAQAIVKAEEEKSEALYIGLVEEVLSQN
jgi:hypothetical protein